MKYYKLELFLLILQFALLADYTHAAIVPASPSINATAYLVMDFNSGKILAEKDIDKRVDPASLTKMMTTYIVVSEIHEGNIGLNDMVRVSEKAWRMEGSRMFIEVDKEVSVENLLKGVIIQSGNDASVALAEYIAGTEDVFAAIMNQYANKLGMKNTNFTNSSGLPDENHYTTTRDLSILANAIIKDHPELYKWHSIKEFTFNGIKQPNRNLLLWRDESVDGIKTGHTESAGYCLVASALRDGMRLITVVMGTEGMESRARASQSLFGYAFRFFETHKYYTKEEELVSAQIWKGDVDTLTLGVDRDVWITIPRGQFKNIKPIVEFEPTIIAPIIKNSVMGNVRLMLDNEEVATSEIIALQDINEGGFIERIKDEIKLFFQ
ncbi:MAG: D-alanyl-D-alanine carboxypeptidase family protein [Gammaproteobacteria bacterium]|jgi:D-alanyl-D-alanine carboxypeptidase (penicillin-binding protein 5/6)